MKDIPPSHTGALGSEVSAQIHRAMAWLREGRTDLALPLLQQLVIQYPDDTLTGMALATAQLREGLAAPALSGFDSILKKQPGHLQALQGRGLALTALGSLPEALDAFRQVVATDPLAWRAWSSIADITPYEDDRIHALEGAADALRVLCQREDAASGSVTAAAEALLNARQPGCARRLLDHRRTGPFDDPAAMRLRARSLYHLGAFAEAFTEATRLYTALPDRTAPPGRPASFEPGQATSVLIEIQSLLATAGVTSFLAAGTLLGFHRSGGPLPHDRDIDIGVLRDTNGAPDIAGILRAHPQILLPRISRPGDRYFGLMHRGVAVDIFLHDQRGGHLVCGVSPLPGDIQWRFSAFTLKTASYGGRAWTIPAAPEPYLTQTYGPAWQTPDPGFSSAVSSPALYQTAPHARAYYAVIRACRARAAGDHARAEALLRQSPIPWSPRQAGTPASPPPADTRPPG